MTTLPQLTARTPGLPCRLDPNTFFSDQARERDAAQRLCQTCPLRTPCARYALEERIPHGVWGGTTVAERRAFWTGKPWRFDDAGRLRLLCGSERAYRAHFAYREKPGAACVGGDCVEAHAMHVEAQRRARLAEEHDKGGTIRGYQIHWALGEPPCDPCRAANARGSASRRRKPSRRLQRPPTPSGTPGNGAAAPAQAFPLAS
ncbi:WhiB family transcriptional regulator [Streptomyces sp. NPDC087317]|uniref:WhiB family transcriptional regulator n=1 Tax=Streptomyces sp. NPDC087317 TaxID=3365784 RepID=UPI0038267F00